MDARVESTTESEGVAGTALNFPVNDSNMTSSSSPPKLPRRLRRRLLESKSPPTTVEGIEAKLKEADLRRQQFYELLSSKARSKPRSLAWSSSQEEDPGQRLEAKLNAAEQKRLSILEKVQKRLARLDELRQSAKNRVEMRFEKERDELSMKVEDRLQRAKRLRAEYLRRKGSLCGSIRASSKMIFEQGDEQGWFLPRKLARYWRLFVRLRGTTLTLAKAYVALEINGKSIKLMPFERLALQIESAAAIQTVKALLDRLESRINLKQKATGTNNLSSLENIDHLLKRIAFPSRRGNPSDAIRGVKKVGSRREVSHSLLKLARYPVRVVLCAYMILGHPDAVFSSKGDCEIALAECAEIFIQEFELLIKIILDGPIQTPQEEIATSVLSRLTFRSQLEAFDKAWCSYLYRFVVWKVKDAKLLEEDFVNAACELELSMMRTCKLTAEGDYGDLTPYMKAIQKQVTEDQKLLKAKVQNLTGDTGLERMECALSDARTRFFEAKEAGCSLASSLAHISSPSSLGSSDGSAINGSGEIGNLAEGHDRSGYIVRSLFKTDESSSGNEVDSSNSKSATDGLLSCGAMLFTENEVLVNEFVHDYCHGYTDGLDVSDEDQESIKAKVRETMEKAFWDGVMESVKQDEPDYCWVLKLMKEVRDELCELSPSSWRQEIVETIDIDIISQVLKSGIFDAEYLGRILEFALVTLQKLSAPANEDEMKTTHQNILKELGEISQAADKSNASFVLLMIKGLRFVLRQIQTLKHEISKVRIRMLEPLLKGPAGLDYLKKAFANHHGTPTDAPASLPLTMQWLSAVRADSEQEWNEYIDSLSALRMSDARYSQGLSPTLRTGGSVLRASTIGAPTSIATGAEQPECKGEKVDLLLRLGLLKLVSEVEGLTVETLPETLKLNLSRLRAVQSQIQKIIVICTSILVLRQALLSENLVTSPIDMENVVSEYVKRLFELLDGVEDVGISEIVDTINGFLEGGDPEKLRARKEVTANMLVKSLRAEDAIFSRVSRTVYLAARGIVLGGTGVKGKQLGETALKRVGAALLTEKLVEAVEVLVVVATMSGSIHGAWYEQMFKNF